MGQCEEEEMMRDGGIEEVGLVVVLVVVVMIVQGRGRRLEEFTPQPQKPINRVSPIGLDLER